MFSGYNKNAHGNNQIRLGNWLEELALKETTGFNRGPKPGSKAFHQSYAKRVIEHTERTEPKDYKSTAHGTHIHPGEFKTFVPMASSGARSRSRQRDFAAQIDREIEDEKLDEEKLRNTFYHETLCAASYTRPDESVYAKTLETLKPKHTACLPAESAGDFEAKSVYDDTATTIYADAVSVNNNQFPLTSNASASGPFGKTSHFTNDIHDAAKCHADPTRDKDAVGFADQSCAESYYRDLS